MDDSATLLPAAGPSDLFAAFCEPLQRAARSGRSEGESEDWLDPETGLAAQWIRALQARWGDTRYEDLMLIRVWMHGCIRDLTDRLEADRLDDEEEEDDRLSYTLELHTWLLLQSLYAERTLPPSPSSSTSTPDPVRTTTSYVSPLSLVQTAISSSPALSELSVVRDWLHSIAYPSLHPAEIRKGYLTYTKNKLKQAIRSNIQVTEASSKSNLVDTLDPDATNRTDAAGKRKVLDSEDANYERALLRSLWEYVRVGELDQAIDMCRQSDASWRAASLSGGKLYSDDIPARRSDGMGDSEDMAILQAEDKTVQGNLRRRLWKSMCRALAGTQHLDLYERALYGAVSGDTASVLIVCETWEDHLWAHVNALLEAQIDNLLEERSNYYLSLSDTSELSTISPSSSLITSNVKLLPQAMQEIFNSLLSEPKLRLEARSPFHVAQSWIILNRTNDLLTSFVSKLEESADILDEP